jgi:penicillin amidase
LVLRWAKSFEGEGFIMLRTVATLALALPLLALCGPAFAAERIAGLLRSAVVTVDDEGISHIRTRNEHDLYFMQGWVHAGDRFFQMDHNRRLASGTLAELLGTAALPSDVQLRTIGLRRAAQRSFDAASARTRAALEAYAEGVNAWSEAHPLPPEYVALGLKTSEPWTPLDSVVIGKLLAFSLSFELDIARTVALRSYVAAGAQAGFDGVKLFSQDLWRSAPFEPDATVPDASKAAHGRKEGKDQRGMERAHEERGDDASSRQMRQYLERVRDIPAFRGILEREARGSSNLWALSGALTEDGRPLLANDPHLSLTIPSTFHPLGLEVHGEPVFGSTLPGVPGVVHGYNRRIAWGSTNNLVDVTDTFQEQVVPDPASPSGLSTLFQGTREPLIPIPQTFRANVGGNVITIPPGGAIPAVTLIVPRRMNGPIIDLDQATGAALSVQYTGFGPTQEIEAFLRFNRARNLDDFKAALQFFDFGSQNFVYADVDGNIAYFTSGEVPVREDLQAGAVNGVPPWFVRTGQGGNEWLPVQHPQPNQATPHEVLPFAEMPQIVNPRAGFFVNANNDPAGVTLDNNPLNQARPGGGIYYLAYSWNRGFRAARINTRLHELLKNRDRRVSFKEMQSIQADVVLRDAEVFTPYIVRAFVRASTPSAPAELRALAQDTGVAEALGRLRRWDGSTPTGIVQGYDAADKAGQLEEPRVAEVRASVAATIYSVWRSRFISRVIDARLDPFGLPRPDDQDSLAALRNLLDNFDKSFGVGASGVDFFVVPGIGKAEDRRDFIILSSLRDALERLRGPDFAAAFGQSENQNDYRWGLLHRVVFAHPLGGPFSIPPAGGFAAPLPGLPGIPTDGGFQTVDASSHSARAIASAGFMFRDGPNHRTVVETRADAMHAESIWPGGTSGILGSPNYAQFLERWLANEALRLRLGREEVKAAAASVGVFVPQD